MVPPEVGKVFGISSMASKNEFMSQHALSLTEALFKALLPEQTGIFSIGAIRACDYA